MNGVPPLPGSLGIPSDKIVRYLLNPEHPKGGSKARFFLRFGFSADRTSEFADALFAQATGAARFERHPTLFGREMLECVGPVWTPSGRKPLIRTVWLVKDEHSAVLVTAFPDRAQNDQSMSSTSSPPP